MKQRLITWGALALGVVLFLAALFYVNVDLAVGTIRRLGPALPLALLFSGLWHLARTWAWAWCFPRPRTVSFLRLARVRLAAEAFSYLTLRGIAGEPLKVVLLADRVPARDATAAVALERVSYLVGTTFIVGIGSFAALVGLPLSPLWFRVFRAFTIAASVLAVLTALVISGRGTYFQAALHRIDAALGTSLGKGLVARFVAAVEAQMLELLRGNPQRLFVLSSATVFAYVCMAAEAWIILRASGDAITPNGALAVETFSRVASFASSFIPANLGALEASSLAAVAAVGASGGAALAIARRIRGLFWAGLGLAIYPRNVRRPDAPVPGSTERPSALRGATLLYFPQDATGAVPTTVRLAGLPLAERVIKSAARAGYARIVVCTAGCGHRDLALLRRLAGAVPGVILASSREAAAEAIRTGDQRFVTAIGPGTAVSPALLEFAATIVPSTGEVRDVPAGPDWPHSGVLRLTTEDAEKVGTVERALGVRADGEDALPSGKDVAEGRARFAARIRTAADLDAAEQTIRRASYKETDNRLARFNRRMSLPISVALIRTPLTANQLSVLLVGIGFYAAWLFSLGHYVAGVVGAFLSLAASILDGCDGEIARLKYQESALGCWIETFGDYSYYIAIFIGLTIGAVRATHVAAFYWIGGLALAGTLVSFALLVFLRTRITAGRPERLHTIAKARFKAEPTWWSRIVWRLSFTATRSAMPYGIFAFALANLLPGIVVLAALGSNVYWISLVVKLRSLLRGGSQTGVRPRSDPAPTGV
jgi:phosphatidylglycerophosphate synthase